MNYKNYVNELPRYGLAVVFAWFGIDKFLIHQYYVSWFSATKSIMVLLPFQDISMSVYSIGIVEICLSALLFLGIKIRVVSSVVIVFLTVILFTAKYPSSFPQDIGLIGIALVLVMSSMSAKNKRQENRFKYSRIITYSVSLVLVLWAADYFLNYERHVGWIHLFSPIFSNLGTNETFYLIVIVGISEILLAIFLIIGDRIKNKYPFVITVAFLIFAILTLDPPINNHQTIGLIMTSFWLGYRYFASNLS
ncbi:MAG: DoxX family membrane protein [Candidatus Nitrosotalea sp.]|nr:DoxX family membrane protein [Candidatus Nitrosotalea sp.]